MRIKLYKKISAIIFLSMVVICCKQQVTTNGGGKAMFADKPRLAQDRNDKANKIVLSENKDCPCDRLVSDLVRSSNALAFNYYSDTLVQARIDNLSDEKAIIKLYIITDISETNTEKRMVESPVGWLEFDRQNHRLLDITNDPENPLVLKYDTTLLKNQDLFKLCDSNPIGVTIEKISTAQFKNARQHATTSKPIVKVTDFKTVQKQLAGVVDFREMDGYLAVRKINFRNGTTTNAAHQLDDCAFSAYFPTEDILLLECGHTTDKSFDLQTGQDTYDVGNLNYVTISPSEKYRLNKVFEGQECFHHFIQKNEHGRYQKIAELNEIFEKKTGKWLCVIEKEFWINDNMLYFGLVTQYKESGNEYEFYKVNIFDK